MTLISSIIADAYRETNMIALGKVPTDAQGAEALRLFQGIIDATYGGDAGESLIEWPLGNFGRPSDDQLPYTPMRLAHPPLNTRLVATNDAAMTVNLCLSPQDGARFAIADPFGRLASDPVTINPGPRTIEKGGTLVLNTNGTFSEWMFRADLGDWVRITSKAQTDEMPFPSRFDQMFVILLAMRLSPRYGRTLDQQSTVVLAQSKREFIARYLQSARLEVNDDIAWPFMSRQGYGYGRDYTSTNSFNTGRAFQ